MNRRVLVLASASHCVNHMFFESLGPLLPFLIVTLDLTHGQAGWLGFVYYVVYGLSSYPSGRWSDRYGRRILIMLFLVIASSATTLMAFSSSYTYLVFLCGLAGFGGGLYHPAGTALVSAHFEKIERGKALGAHASGGSIGVLLAFVVVGGIASHWNWRIALISLSFLGFALAICFKLLLWNSDRHPQNEKQEGLASENENISSRGLIRLLLYMLFIYGTVMFIWKGAYTWIPTYLKETYNLSSGMAIMFSVILPSIGVFSNYLMGRFSDYYGRKRSLVLVFAFLALAFFLLFLGKRPLLIPLLVLMGFFLNSFSGIINAYVGDVIPFKLLARAFGILFAFSFCIGALASYLMGLISDVSSLSMSMLLLGIISLAGAIVSIIIPRKFTV